MKQKKVIIIFILVIALLLVAGVFYYNKQGNIIIGDNRPPYENYCETKEDCVPAQCCHPNSVVNKYYSPDCKDVFCTLLCTGPLDCGAGFVNCQNNRCVITTNNDGSNIITNDKDCARFNTLEEKDSCCAELHRNDAHILCIGDWVFTDDKICVYQCGGRISEEHLELTYEEYAKIECDSVGGTWTVFNDGCVDSCEKARNPSGIFCTQAFTFGCDCGIDKCWNRETCEEN